MKQPQCTECVSCLWVHTGSANSNSVGAGSCFVRILLSCMGAGPWLSQFSIAWDQPTRIQTVFVQPIKSCISYSTKPIDVKVHGIQGVWGIPFPTPFTVVRSQDFAEFNSTSPVLKFSHLSLHVP